MELPIDRAGPYLRALAAGLDALAPHDDFVPLHEALATLRALDPAFSGDVLAPPEIDRASGMPGFPWISRAVAEQRIARMNEGSDNTDTEIDRALGLDRELGERMAARRRLHGFLREESLLHGSRVFCAARRLRGTTVVRATHDRLSPDGRWTRVRFDVGWTGTKRNIRPFTLHDDGTVEVEEGLLHLISRHAAIPLLALREQLESGLNVQVSHVSRTHVGPFWFPGVSLPGGLPSVLASGLLLHLCSEVVSTEVHTSRHQDALSVPDKDEVPPEGMGIFRARRFAAAGAVVEPVSAWLDERGMRASVVRFG